MSEAYELSAETRVEHGKASSRRLRRLENKVPAIIYGGEQQPTMIKIDHNVLSKALENETLYSHILTLTVDGKKEKVVIKDLHRHPSKPRILHADFQRVSAKTPITMYVPIHFIGAEDSLAVKNQGGIVSHLITEVEVRCLPEDLPEHLEVDISGLSIGEMVHLSEIKLPKGVEITTLLQGKDYDQPVVNIHKPTIEVVAEEVAPTEEEEVISPAPTAPKTGDESGV